MLGAFINFRKQVTLRPHLVCSGALLLKVRAANQQHRHHLGVWTEMQCLSGTGH